MIFLGTSGSFPVIISSLLVILSVARAAPNPNCTLSEWSKTRKCAWKHNECVFGFVRSCKCNGEVYDVMKCTQAETMDSMQHEVINVTRTCDPVKECPKLNRWNSFDLYENNCERECVSMTAAENAHYIHGCFDDDGKLQKLGFVEEESSKDSCMNNDDSWDYDGQSRRKNTNAIVIPVVYTICGVLLIGLIVAIVLLVKKRKRLARNASTKRGSAAAVPVTTELREDNDVEQCQTKGGEATAESEMIPLQNQRV